ncbi:MAG: hypothetical protein RBJ76_08200 [Stenomitos frigidus ULC029]
MQQTYTDSEQTEVSPSERHQRETDQPEGSLPGPCSRLYLERQAQRESNAHTYPGVWSN